MSVINPLFRVDFYKVGHINQYPSGTEEIYSNLTARSSKLAQKSSVFDDGIVVFGTTALIKEFFIEHFNEGFFNRPKDEVVNEYKTLVDNALGCDMDVSHIAALHDLGYLPLEIKALPEGSFVNIRVPFVTIRNTKPDFFWLTNYVETTLSSDLWKPCTVATIARQYKKLLTKYADLTGVPREFVLWQGHDFALRGLSGFDNSTAGHLTSFLGTDTVSAIVFVNKYYHGDKTFVGGSVPATEHSVMCAGGQESELQTFERLLEIYKTGVISIVSDTWDFWKVIAGPDSIAAKLKDKILNRKPNAVGLAKVVFRPDSGNPVDILCGDVSAAVGSPESKGAVQCLWETFGGTINEKGYKVLNERVGLIYGDSITLERAEAILSRLAAQGFASSNVVFGIGSFTYQYITRDSFGMAVKATNATINGKDSELFKDPITDNGTKRSAKGLLRVEKINEEYVLFDQQTREQERQGELKTIFLDGMLMIDDTIEAIRKRVDESL
jgi:nicotinamide phosphoribosyltransferase